MSKLLVTFALVALVLLVDVATATSNRFFEHRDWTPSSRDPAPWLNPLDASPASMHPFSTLSKAVHDAMRAMGMYFPDLTDNWRAFSPNRLPAGVYARETDAERLFFIDLPGFHRSDVRVELIRGHIVSVRAERNCDKDDAYCISRAVKQDFIIDDDIDVNKITVNLDAGELRVHLPKRAATRFTIPIVDRLFGLNQPSHDSAGDKLPVRAVKSSSGLSTADSAAGSDEKSGAIHWPSMAAGADDPERYQKYLDVMRDAAGRVAEGAEAVRERSKSQASEWMDQVHQAAEHAGGSIQHVWNAASDTVGHTADEAGESAGTVRDRAKDTIKTTQQRVKDATDEARQGVKRAETKIKDAAQAVRDSAKGHVVDPMVESAHEASNRIKHAADEVKHKAGGLFGWFGDVAGGVQEAAHHCVDCIGQGYEEGKAKHHEQHHHEHHVIV